MICSTDGQERQHSESHGASILQGAPHLCQLLPALDGARHDALREMQPGAREGTEGTTAPELRARCQSGRLRAVPQAARDSYQQALPEVPRSPRSPEATQQVTQRATPTGAVNGLWSGPTTLSWCNRLIS